MPAAGLNEHTGQSNMNRHSKLLWMQEVLEQLDRCYDEWSIADARSEQFVVATLHRHLDELRRLCESLRKELPSADADRAVAAA
jgi:hypothetical protein